VRRALFPSPSAAFHSTNLYLRTISNEPVPLLDNIVHQYTKSISSLLNTVCERQAPLLTLYNSANSCTRGCFMTICTHQTAFEMHSLPALYMPARARRQRVAAGRHAPLVNHLPIGRARALATSDHARSGTHGCLANHFMKKLNPSRSCLPPPPSPRKMIVPRRQHSTATTFRHARAHAREKQVL
jgi:hypothetical protein